MLRNIKNIGKRFSVFVLAIFCALFLVEIFLRSFYLFKQDYDIEMWKYATRLKMSVDDLRSHIHKPNSQSKIMGADVVINSKGLRGREIDYVKGVNESRILILGDSITFGFGVDQEDLFSEIIQNKLSLKDKNITVINSGVGNYNLEQEFEFLRKEGIHYNPDEVVLVFYINDLEKTSKNKNHFFSNSFILYPFLNALKINLLTFNSENQSYIQYYKNLYNPKNLSAFEDIFIDLNQFIQSKNLKLRVVLVPEIHDLKQNQFHSEYAKIQQILEKHGVEYVNTFDKFNVKISSDYYWVAPDDVHPNKHAHQIIADSIFNTFYNE